RIKKIQESKVGALTAIVSVTLDGRPLGGATVTFDPEPFLGVSYVKITGTTGDSGIVNMILDPNDRPGVPPGLYKIRISKQINGKEVVPPKYNTDTTLGIEVASDNMDLVTGGLKFDLKSK